MTVLRFVLLSLMAIGCEATSEVRLTAGQEDVVKNGKAAGDDGQSMEPPRAFDVELVLTREAAVRFAQLAADCIQREYPNKPAHVMNDEGEVQSPRSLHPSFYGCYDWHSAVHGHWLLVRLLRLFPRGLPNERTIRSALEENLSARNVLLEAAYFGEPNRRSFERTYGWAWLLKLAEELHGWDDADGRRWSKNLAPLVEVLVHRYLDFLPRQTYPIRTGVHPNTAFGLAFALDYARAVGDEALEALARERSLTYFESDRDAPARWEPGGEDFFSPSLMEADLMRRVMEPAAFTAWLQGFLPGLALGKPRRLLEPATVSDRTDPKIVHLDGLNLSRAWCMRGIASVLPDGDATRRVLESSATRHAADALTHVASGDYAGEHWLATFAVFLMSGTRE